MRITSAQLNLDHDFVDICKLLVTAPHAVAPPQARVSSRRLVRHADTDVWVQLEPLEVVTSRRAQLRLTWRTNRIRPDLRAGNGVLEIEALARPPCARTELTLTVKPLRWPTTAVGPIIGIGRPRLGDFAQRALRAFGRRITAELSRESDRDEHGRMYVEAWLRELDDGQREQQA